MLRYDPLKTSVNILTYIDSIKLSFFSKLLFKYPYHLFQTVYHISVTYILSPIQKKKKAWTPTIDFTR